jgi:hypothetical protein
MLDVVRHLQVGGEQALSRLQLLESIARPADVMKVAGFCWLSSCMLPVCKGFSPKPAQQWNERQLPVRTCSSTLLLTKGLANIISVMVSPSGSNGQQNTRHTALEQPQDQGPT